MVRSTYDYIKSKEDDKDFLLLFRKGFMPLNVLNMKVYYERYMLYMTQNNNLKTHSIKDVCAYYNVSYNTVRKAIKTMEREWS